jgi:hypothetical protein
MWTRSNFGELRTNLLRTCLAEPPSIKPVDIFAAK